jgi:hypothetical protein
MLQILWPKQEAWTYIDSDFAVKPTPPGVVKVQANIRNFARKNIWRLKQR